jgi:eukaryotic-like serine/threonine-protein kinase
MTQPRLLGDRYELEGVVGRGGMAEVYRARDIRLDRVVAIKTLRSDLARDQTFQARFRREAQSAASLNNPNIVAVYDTGEDMSSGGPIPYIVMEYVDGRTVRELLVDGHRLLPERALEITTGVLRALEYSHQAGIVHRDIKPGNVMVTRNGDIKVMDFGIARAMSDSQATMTQTAQVIGTAQYLSPEQARGERVDARSDLYSTGCLLYELLVGRPPFTGDSPVAIAYQHVRENPVPPSRLDPDIPSWADAIVLKAMAKSPADRYQSAAEMQADVQRAASGMQVAAMPPAPPTRADYYGGPPTQRVGQTMGAGPTSMIPSYADDYNQYGYDNGGMEPRGGARRWLPWVIGLALVLVVAIAAGYVLLGGNGKSYFVPQVTGETAVKAEQQIRQAGLTYTVHDEASSAVAKGVVISANPTDGTGVQKGQLITLNVSTGASKVTIPTDLVGQQEAQAVTELSNLGLHTGTPKTDQNSSKPAGTVLSVNPPGGTAVDPNSTVVTLTISGGSTAVPPVTGLSLSSAETLLKQDGFKFNAQQVAGPAGTTPGFVWNQNPQQGTLEPPNFVVTIDYQPQATPTTPATPTASASPTAPATGSPGPGNGNPGGG